MKTFFVPFLAALIAIPLFGNVENAPRCRCKSKASVFVSYANAHSNPNLEQTLMINLGFNGNSNYTQFVMDTGSCGIVASEDNFTPAPDAINLGPGATHYTDGTFSKELTGTVWSASQQIYDETGKLIATANVPVLQVTQEIDNGGTPFTPHGIAVMGIGFGREGSDTPAKTPAFNPFLNLTSILGKKGKLLPLPKNWVNGYIVTPTGVKLGLTAKNTARAGFIKLTPWPQYSTPTLPEWMPMSMTVCINGVCGDGMSIMDTGIRNAIVNPPPGANLGTLVNCPGTTMAQCFPDGDIIQVYYPNKTNPVAYYTFTTGGQTGNPMQPISVAEQMRPTIFWNTGRHFIGGINFVYDNKHGLAGFIWNGNTSHEFGYVRPNHKHKKCH
jgi:hypothetical protein